jgi:hypothetical protein
MSNTTPSYNLKQQKQSSSFQSFSIRKINTIIEDARIFIV